MVKGNRLRERLANGTRQIGLWSSTGSVVAAEIMALSGADWILMDLEHGFGDNVDLLHTLCALENAGVDPAVRLPWNDIVMIRRALDAGARTLVIPQVDDAEAARAAGRAGRFPPAGVRGVSGTPRANGYGRRTNYTREADDEVAIIVQIESEAAVRNAAEICGVSEIDAVFIGPADLSASMGFIGQPTHSDVEAAARTAIDAARAAGKPAGVFAGASDQMARYAEWGVTLFAVGTDAGLLARAADATVANARTALT